MHARILWVQFSRIVKRTKINPLEFFYPYGIMRLETRDYMTRTSSIMCTDNWCVYKSTDYTLLHVMTSHVAASIDSLETPGLVEPEASTIIAHLCFKEYKVKGANNLSHLWTCYSNPLSICQLHSVTLSYTHIYCDGATGVCTREGVWTRGRVLSLRWVLCTKYL